MANKNRNQSNQRSGSPPRKGPAAWVWIIVGVAAIGILALGYLGVGSSNRSVNPKVSNVSQPPSKNGFSWDYRAESIKTGKLSHLVRGSHMTIVMLMASWCLYCAYDDKYVWPTVIHTPGLVLDIVDVSSRSGIGDPGPYQPAFSGHDNPGPTVGVSGMRRTMTTYVQQFGLTASNIHVFVDPEGMTYFSVTMFPTVLFINQNGDVERVNGALTPSTAASILHQIDVQNHG